MDSALTPRVRTDDLVLTAFDGELLIQDTVRHKAHALNAQAAAVFRLADGSHTVEEIAVLASMELGETVAPEVVWYALGLLQRLHLLAENVVPSDDRITRKALLTRVGTAAALASIASITVPALGAHASVVCGHAGILCTAKPSVCCPSVPCETTSLGLHACGGV